MTINRASDAEVLNDTPTMRIVIVGGGAGGLELATKLGRAYRKSTAVSVLLLDKHPFHVWKPLFHEVASGSLDVDMDGIDFRSHAANHGFEFQLGTLDTLDRTRKEITLDSILDDDGAVLIPERYIDYDILVIAIGSITNDFGIPGVRSHCLTIDDTHEAERFHKGLLNQFLKIKAEKKDSPLTVTIVGAGATGVELTAELYKVADYLRAYGFTNIDRSSLIVNLIEASGRILNALPPRIAVMAGRVLNELGVRILVNTKVQSVGATGVFVDDGAFLPSDITVWCAGVKCQEVLDHIGGLPTNRNHQIIVNSVLQAEDDESIFALGDCAAFEQGDGTLVPPRAQSAHQMAAVVATNIQRQLKGQALKPFRYRDHGSLVSFAEYTSVGVLSYMTKHRVFVEGGIAKYLYVSLYRLHQVALHGYFNTFLMMIVGRINRKLRPRLKLH
ncbi:MAG: NAD(P)/FAD-dependent oxidoreductase [Alcanivorax sp.]|uniref:NAD(P)/FAD-dependent oxidoreductase n=1 Tax=Thalassolituus oleivorans TaxID=187493 RepID=UPI0023EFDC93|nr:NAD(P)/FAD-dependent oxidoreductase [Thalassolituus oleivorans]